MPSVGAEDSRAATSSRWRSACSTHSCHPEHERRAAEIIREECPDVWVSISSVVLPQFREFERSMATVLNAYVTPHVSRYLRRSATGSGRGRLDRFAPVHHEVERRRHQRAEAARQAIHTALSGPAGGRDRAPPGSRAEAGLRRHHLDRRGWHQRRRQPGPGRQPAFTVRGQDRRLSASAADRGHPHDRGGRRQHRARHLDGAAGGRAAERRRRARARSATARAAPSRP